MNNNNKNINRRRFLTLLSGSAAGLALSSCSDDIDTSRYNNDDIQLLAKQKQLEAQNSGKGPYGIHRYQGYRGLAELPWFELDSKGVLQCVDDSIPMAIDAHCHFGMSVLFEPDLDLQLKTERVRHLLDCDAENPGCELDLDIYVNGNFTEQTLSTLNKNIVAQGLWGSSFAETQTIPNLLQEMDSMRVQQAMILPIKLDLPFGDNQTETWRDAVIKAKQTNRLGVGFSIYAHDENRLEQMREFAKSGAKILKLHPTVQKFFPDDPIMMPVYELAQELGLVIFFHGGRAGIEPESSHPYAMPRHYEGAISGYPKLPFILGHGGARDHQAMLELAVRYDNAWLGIHGQGITSLDQMIRRTDGERLLFGSDWPFYHIGASLAKVLITTQDKGRHDIRAAILRENALKLFG